MKSVITIVALFAVLALIIHMITLYCVGRGMTWGSYDKPNPAIYEQEDDPGGR